MLRELVAPARLTQVVDVGANPIDGEPPCLLDGEQLKHATAKGSPRRYLQSLPA